MYITKSQKYYADSMAFFGLQGRLPVFDPSHRPLLSLAHLTSVRPFVRDFDAALEEHRLFRKQALSNQDVHEIRSRSDLPGKPKSIGLVFGMQHAPEGLTLKRVRQLYDEGIRSMAIAYDVPNEYGHGYKGAGQLTKRGSDLVGWLGECGIILDLSHAGYRTAMDAITLIILEESFPTKVMASHSGCHAVYPHPRNLTDDMIRRIRFLNGYIGIPAITFLIAKKGDAYLKAFARHVTHAVRVCGDSEIIGIGSDCNHMDMSMEDAQLHFKNMLRMLKTDGTLGAYFPDRPVELILHGSCMFDCFDDALKWPLNGLLGKNFENFLARAL